jgi:hypothetical protein
MDEELYQRFLEGDDAATTGIRNHMRAIATRVLAAPQWGLEEGQPRRELEQEAVAEAMGTPPEHLVGAATAVMQVATRTGLAHLRREDHVTGEHPDVSLMAALALEVLPPDEAQAAEAHLADCMPCLRHVASAKNALRTAVSAQKTAVAPPKPLPQREAIHASARREPAGAKSLARFLPSRSTLGIVAPLVVLGLAMFLHWQSQQLDPVQALQDKVGHLLPAELPPSARAWELEQIGKDAVSGLGEGRCEYAVRRLGVAMDQNPDQPLHSYYLGLAHVCLRQGPQARSNLEWVQANMDPPPFGLDWWLAQAHLLDGGVDEGLALLDSLAASDHPRAPFARDLAAKVRAEL